MKKTLLISMLIFFSINIFAQDFGYWASAVELTLNASDNYYNTDTSNNSKISSLEFSGSLGSFPQNSGALQITGGKIKTYKNSNSNVCGGTLYYTIYPEGNRPDGPVFNGIDFGFISDCSGNTFPNDATPCTAGDQQWGITSAGTDLTTLSTGDYTMEIYYRIRGAYNSTSDCSDTIYDNNNNPATNYYATFTIDPPLPLCLVNCSVGYANSGAMVKWTTTNEINVKNFAIERSTDGKTFNVISSINAKGNFNSNNAYSFSDNNLPNADKVYYRLKIIDDNGKFNYSSVMPVSIKADDYSNTIHLTTSRLNIYNTSAINNGSIRLTDITGRIITTSRTTITAGSAISIQLQQKLTGGIYVVSIDNGSGKLITKKTVVN